MPRKSKDEKELNLKSTTKKNNNKQETKTTKTTTSKKVEPKSTKSGSKKSLESSSNEKKAEKSVSKKKQKSTKTLSKAVAKTRKSKKEIEVIEYYDLPYRYNQTVIKLLFQTPTSLFVYWDISDDDRKNFISKYGEKFFLDTKPILLVHNETNNYTFEIEINDFANCWYLHVNDTKCVYNIELGRKYKNIYTQKNNDYIHITSSNKLETPNDHILFNNINNTVCLKNTKTNTKIEKKISDISSIQNIEKIYNIYDLYKKIYSEEDIENFNLKNPSSTLSSSSFKI